MKLEFPQRQQQYFNLKEQKVYEVVGTVKHYDTKEVDVLFKRFRSGSDSDLLRLPLEDWHGVNGDGSPRFRAVWVEQIKASELRKGDYFVWLGKAYPFVKMDEGIAFKGQTSLYFDASFHRADHPKPYPWQASYISDDFVWEFPYKESDDNDHFGKVDVIRNSRDSIADVESWTEDGQRYTAIKIPSYVHCYTDQWVVLRNPVAQMPDGGKVQIEAADKKEIAVKWLQKRGEE